MRLWTLHPRYLDRLGLLALWREGLLAQAVLLGETRGYRHHPQLTRFREQTSPTGAIAAYLEAVHRESQRRGYQFDRSRIRTPAIRTRLLETRGQLLFEWSHLLSKLHKRSPEQYDRIHILEEPEPHPLFDITDGEIQDWERGNEPLAFRGNRILPR